MSKETEIKMSKETEIKMGLSYLDDYEQELEECVGNKIVSDNRIKLISSCGGPFNIEAGRYGWWIGNMEEKLDFAEQKLNNSKMGLIRLNYLRATHAALFEDNNSKRRKRAIAFYEKAIELGGHPKDMIYDRMAITNWVLDGKIEDTISYYEKVVEIAGIDSSNGMDAAKTLERLKSQKSGCFIATAVYESYDAPEVIILRKFRDDILNLSKYGQLFVKSYYFFSPPISKFLSKKSKLKVIVREKILTPFVRYIENKLNK